MERVAVIEKWLNDMVAKQAEKPKNVDPVLTSAEVMKKRDEIIFFATPILTKPKPKPPVIPTGSTPASGTGTPKPQTPQPPEANGEKKEVPVEEKKAEGGSGMDVD